MRFPPTTSMTPFLRSSSSSECARTAQLTKKNPTNDKLFLAPIHFYCRSTTHKKWKAQKFSYVIARKYQLLRGGTQRWHGWEEWPTINQICVSVHCDVSVWVSEGGGYTYEFIFIRKSLTNSRIHKSKKKRPLEKPPTHGNSFSLPHEKWQYFRLMW